MIYSCAGIKMVRAHVREIRWRFARRKGGDFLVMVRTKGAKGTQGTKGRFTGASREEARR